MKRRRVKITGIGPVTPAGIGKEAFWKGILEPVSRVREFTGLGEAYGPHVAAFIDDFDASTYVDESVLPKGAARQTEFAIVGTALAMADAKISLETLQRARTTVVTGSCLMDFQGLIGSFESVLERGARHASPRIVYTACVGSVSSGVSAAFGLRERSVAVSSQCSSGMDAFCVGASLIASGEADFVVCGGTDAPMQRTPFLEMRAGRWISKTAERASQQVRPFDMWRTTSALAEGCVMFVLEPETSERPGYSFVLGQGFGNDSPDDLCSGLSKAARFALANAEMRPQQVEVLNAWGPGDASVDIAEARAMQQVFGDHLPDIATTSIKGAVGSALGAAPAMQIAVAALGQRNGIVPPTVNWDFPDPGCALNLSNQPRQLEHVTTLVNSHGIGANNGCVVLQKC